jgi:hypothetical protein
MKNRSGFGIGAVLERRRSTEDNERELKLVPRGKNRLASVSLTEGVCGVLS